MGKCSFLKANDVRALAQNNLLLWTEICGIQRAILEASSLCGKPYGGALETIVNDGTPMTWVSGIASVTVTDGGADYEPVVAEATITSPVVDGVSVTSFTLASGSVEVDNGGAVTEFFNLPGSPDWAPVPLTLAAFDDAGGTVPSAGNGASFTFGFSSGGGITQIFGGGGTGYLVGEYLLVDDNPGAGGTGFLAQIASIGGAGEIVGINILSNGSGYIAVANSTIAVTHPTGVGFEGTVQTNLAGEIVGISIQNGGSGYFSLLPTAYIIDNEATGAGAVLEITETDIVGGVIQNINIVTSGFGYSQDVDVVITPALTSTGDNATAVATVTPDPLGYGANAPAYYEVLSGQSSNRVIQSQIEFVKDYFTALGYNIRPKVNVSTGNTMVWQISW